jgi:hypothetical protein
MNINFKNFLVISGDRNSEDKIADYTGVFLPEALAYMKTHNIPITNHHRVNLSYSESSRRFSVYNFIKKKYNELGQIEGIAFFCYGLNKKIQLGIRISDLQDFSYLIKEVMPKKSINFAFALYCCSIGDDPGIGGDRGFADCLRDEMCKAGITEVTITAHSESGHATKNSSKKKFDGMGSPVGGTGGLWIVAPKSTLWTKWKKLIIKTDLRFRVPFMTIAEIHKELDS